MILPHCGTKPCVATDAFIAPNATVGIGAVLLDGCEIGEGSTICAGAVVPEGVVIAPRSIVLGVPGKRVREAGATELARIDETCDSYRALAVLFRETQR